MGKLVDGRSSGDSARLVLPALDRGSATAFEHGGTVVGTADALDRLDALGTAVEDRGHDGIDLLAVQTTPTGEPDRRRVEEAVGLPVDRVVGPDTGGLEFVDEGTNPLDDALDVDVGELGAGDTVEIDGTRVHALNPSRTFADRVAEETDESVPKRQAKAGALSLAFETDDRTAVVTGPVRAPATTVVAAHYGRSVGPLDEVDAMVLDGEAAVGQRPLLERARPATLHYFDRETTHDALDDPTVAAEADLFADEVTAASCHGRGVVALDPDGVAVTSERAVPAKDAFALLRAVVGREEESDVSVREAVRAAVAARKEVATDTDPNAEDRSTGGVGP